MIDKKRIMLYNEDMERKTTEQFIIDAINIHGNKYDYSKVNYINSQTKIEIICPIHGSFLQKPNKHLMKRGCSKCYGNNKKTTEDFILNAINMHGNEYDYSKVNYINSRTKVEIVCPIHGSFLQKANNHLLGQKCSKCYGNNKLSVKRFIERAIKIHGNKYDYSLSKYINYRTKIKIICPVHGEFLQVPQSHLRGSGCRLCNISKGEMKIEKFLIEKNFYYEREKSFLKINKLRFDFYLPKRNICIEYDGMQHFQPIEYFGGIDQLYKTQFNDAIKNKYCNDNNIKLLRIAYNEDINCKLSNCLTKKE